MVFTHLKQETHTQHTQLEQTIDILNRMQNKTQYLAILRTFYGFYQPLEERLDRVHGIEIINFKSRHKVGLLHNDLLMLGLPETEITQLPLCVDLPRVETLTEALGCLYVLEGATLGGQIITRRIKELPDQLPHSFFTSYGPQVGKYWTELRAFVEQFVHEPHVCRVLVAAAQETFSTLDQWFQRQLSHHKDAS